MIIPFLPYRTVIESKRSAYCLFTQIETLDLRDRLVNTSGYDLIVTIRNSDPLIYRVVNYRNSIPGLTNGRFNSVLWAAFYESNRGCKIETEVVSGVFTFIFLGLFCTCFIVSIYFAGITSANTLVLGTVIFLLAVADSHAKRKVLREFERLILVL